MIQTYRYRKHNYEGIRIWFDEVVDGFRHIYLRCGVCSDIIELTNKEGTLKDPITIERGFISPCVICPSCGTHLFVRLNRYEKTDIPDVFELAKRKRETL